ncbi:MAG: hypothetical protein JSS49_20570 [Planctomycetes bacterium]|nr:hypothetical protein [Planctomycetota bacterium]
MPNRGRKSIQHSAIFTRSLQATFTDFDGSEYRNMSYGENPELHTLFCLNADDTGFIRESRVIRGRQ